MMYKLRYIDTLWQCQYNNNNYVKQYYNKYCFYTLVYFLNGVKSDYFTTTQKQLFTLSKTQQQLT